MNVSLNSIKHYLDFELGSVDELVQKIGAQLGAIEAVTPIGHKYQGIIIAKVVSCEQHPNADRLHVCLLDDGGKAEGVERNEHGLVQVVCGAPNVRAGLLVAWLPPGATVPESVDNEPFVLEARELRGVVSNGMLASAKELALGEDHDGILVIDGDYAPGSDFAEAFNLKDDVILELENKMFTHRPDCFGVLGVAREIAGIYGQPFHSPDWYRPQPGLSGAEQVSLPLTVRNELPELVPRFSAIAMSGVQVGPSPAWLKVALAKVGQRSINNIVDYTNYFMLETGQPLHAYDYDKVKALDPGAETATLVVRNPHEGETIDLLNGKTLDPRQEAIMIATDTTLIGTAGVMGGEATEVDETTQNIIVESASFDMYSVRRTSMAHGLFTEAVTRFNKGQSPLQTTAVLAKIVDEIASYAQGTIASQLANDVQLPEATLQRGALHPPVVVQREFITARLGIDISTDTIKQLLENVECVVQVDGEQLTIQAPFWRTDIELREDVVEEVGRLYGFDKLPADLPQRSVQPVDKNELFMLKSAIRESLSVAGANELLTYSFVPGSLLEKVGQKPEDAYKIGNALSPDLQYYRLSIAPSLLDKVHPNIKAGYGSFGLFEIGKTHILGQEVDSLPQEFDRVAFVFAADKKAAGSYAGAAFYQARMYLATLLNDLNVPSTEVRYEPLAEDTSYYAAGRSATIYVGSAKLGTIGEYKSLVRRALKLPDFVAGFELDLAPLLNQATGSSYTPLPRFPSITQDITLQVPTATSYQDLRAVFSEALTAAQPENVQAALTLADLYQSTEDTAHKQVTLRFSIASHDRTLIDKEVAQLLETAAASTREKLGL